jgi:hypothetical protein
MEANFRTVRRKVVWGTGTAVAAALSSVLLAGCGELNRQGQASVYLQMESLLGANTGSTTFSTEVLSDVANYVDAGGGQLAITRAPDAGQATFRLAMKDPLLAPTSANAITLTSYRVQFRRTDGRNTPGVDVPYSFDGTLTVTISPGVVGSVGFTLVRGQAKFEAPLRALTGAGSTLTIATIAHVAFFGHDATGTDVSVEGDITVYFADWPDAS